MSKLPELLGIKQVNKHRWADRAVRLLESVQAAGAPQEVQFAASDAVQHFVWATDCRKQSRPKGPVGDNYLPGWGAKADKAHYHGKKCFAIAQKWLDQHRSTQSSSRVLAAELIA